MRRKGFSQILLISICVVNLFPIYYIIISAFKSLNEYYKNLFGFPSKPTLANFIQVFNEGDFSIWFRNSVIVTILSVLVITLISSLAAFAISKMNFRGRNLLLRALITLMIIPPVVMIIPLFNLMVKIKLINNFSSVIIIYSGLQAPFSVYLLQSFFGSVDNEILSAASIDGCSTFQIYTKIILPLAKPALITQTIVNGLWVWNELMISLIFLQGNEIRTLMPGLTQFQGRFSVNQPVIMAGALMAILPIFILYLFGQKYFIKGFTTGAIK
jgi:ABC-type glycerol-3-phosphate transport system permease component